ncbi:MAG: recombinase [Aquabacterium sp.]|jgi:site-specific recombinase|uniref:site-specific recombinase n=1 Tax=Aquabacterium sp. TaxID=1872578 RepID=UPI003BAF1127
MAFRLFSHANPPVSIDQLLENAPHQGSAAQRHLWLIEVLRWVRQGESVSGLQYVVRHVGDHPKARRRVVALLAACLRDLHFSSLLADHGFAPRAAFMSEFSERLRRRMLPSSPETRELSTLFGLLFDVDRDPIWISKLDDATMERLGDLFSQAWHYAEDSPLGWRQPFMEALSILASQVRAAGVSPELRLRMGDGPSREVTQTFGQLARAAEDLHDLLEDVAEAEAPALPAHADDTIPSTADLSRPQLPAKPDEKRRAAVLQQAQYVRGLLDHCMQLAMGVHNHLEAYGVSVDVVFHIDQLRARGRRIEQVLDCLLAPKPHREMRALVLGLIQDSAERRSLRALFTRHYSLLARLVAERNAETGEHYITRTRAAYFDMLRRAAGGGIVLAGTTFLKFFLLALAGSAFWGGFAAGINYATSFVIIYLLHWRVATKQPAMTAPAMAAKLGDAHTEEGAAGFTDEVVHLIRSQMAGIIGNLALVFPAVLAIQALAWWLLGHPLIGDEKAHHTLESLTLLGPSVFFAAFTGILLFTSSIFAGWFENWFVWHRIDSAMQWHPRSQALLGPERAARWAAWWRRNVSGLAANVSLGLTLGLVPPIAAFFGLPLEVRHVTLSTGQIAAALGTLGLPALNDPLFWWCMAAIPLTGLFNVGVSFALALRVALRSRGVRVKDRSRLWKAMGRRFLRHPFSFVLPPSKRQEAREAAERAQALVQLENAAEAAPSSTPEGKPPRA